MKFLLLGTALRLAAPRAEIAQAAPLPTAAELKKDIKALASYSYKPNSSVEPEELAARTARKLVKYLLMHDLSAITAEKLGLVLNVDSKDAAHLRVYTFYYHSGGLRGTIDIPVLQWKNVAGQRFAYALDMESAFDKIYKLTSSKRTSYLLLGYEQDDWNCRIYTALVVELKGNYLLLDNAAFGRKPSLRLCNMEIIYQSSKQVLYLDVSDAKAPLYNQYNDDALSQINYRRKPSARSVALKFSGGRFIISK